MTRQYVAGELSLLLARVHGVATTEAARREAWLLQHAAETVPLSDLSAVTVRALALAEGLCWDSLSRGDTTTFARQAAVCAELHQFGLCAGLLREGLSQAPPGRPARDRQRAVFSRRSRASCSSSNLPGR
jgi:hypothetical protein